MNFKQKSEYIYYAVNNLSFWKSYFNKENKKVNVISNENQDAVVFYSEADEFISIFGGSMSIEKNGDKWDVEIWSQSYSYDNGYADSDYVLVGSFSDVNDAIKTLLQIPVQNEIDAMSENYYYDC